MVRPNDAGDRCQTPDQRSIRLLNDNLTAKQREQYAAYRYFDVTGGESGRRYRLWHRSHQNIEAFDAHGNRQCLLCFHPRETLPGGDVMLAQKTALELFESEILKIAHRYSQFAGGGPETSREQVLDGEMARNPRHRYDFRGNFFYRAGYVLICVILAASIQVIQTNLICGFSLPASVVNGSAKALSAVAILWELLYLAGYLINTLGPGTIRRGVSAPVPSLTWWKSFINDIRRIRVYRAGRRKLQQHWASPLVSSAGAGSGRARWVRQRTWSAGGRRGCVRAVDLSRSLIA